MKQDSCCVLSKMFSHETGFMLRSFPEVFSCHRVHVLFFPRVFFSLNRVHVLFFQVVFS